MEELKEEEELVIITFAYKPKAPLFVADVCIIDCRCLPNPWQVVALRGLPGDHKAVLGYLLKEAQPVVEKLFAQAMEAYEAGCRKFAFGCVGGTLRSRAMAAYFERRLDLTIKNSAI